jgi:hypothetical protein
MNTFFFHKRENNLCNGFRVRTPSLFRFCIFLSVFVASVSRNVGLCFISGFQVHFSSSVYFSYSYIYSHNVSL